MNDQMEQVWRCKDGKGGFVTGSKEEVEAYLKSKNPLAGMRFPYFGDVTNRVFSSQNPLCVDNQKEVAAIVAFANLATDAEELRQVWGREWRSIDWRTYQFADPALGATQKFLLAYEEALKQVPQ